jgi:hypothetical protein
VENILLRKKLGKTNQETIFLLFKMAFQQTS